ncbi:hypothetical protein HPP92_019306 [Vanilla planifolia]|uniref:Uncharacterized protein n=1 Tax=Vanilla planifolia TaxID=51239 RepID=A0A835UKM0_VANPL|nr:hypothetical protein HPP92_019306 [Vanilla planifolia]
MGRLEEEEGGGYKCADDHEESAASRRSLLACGVASWSNARDRALPGQGRRGREKQAEIRERERESGEATRGVRST